MVLWSMEAFRYIGENLMLASVLILSRTDLAMLNNGTHCACLYHLHTVSAAG